VPGPPWSPESHGLAWVAGIELIAVGICIVMLKQARLAAALLGATLVLRALVVFLPRLIMHVHDPAPWTSGSEVLALGGAVLVLAGVLPGELPDSSLGWNNALDVVLGAGRYLFAIALVVIGVQHFMYAKFVATLVPAWIPWHLFWTYFVGVAFFAAAASIAKGKMVRLAGGLLGILFLLFVITLHVPRVAAAPRNGNEWTSEFVALAFCGAAFVLAGALAEDEYARYG
jgi:uncharacterized membrane protein